MVVQSVQICLNLFKFYWKRTWTIFKFI